MSAEPRCKIRDGKSTAWASALLAVAGSLLAATAPAAERVYVQERNPSRLLAFSFDGASFAVEDPSPGSPAPYELAAFDAFGLAATDRWILLGYQGQGITLGLMDPATGQELPIVSDPSGGFNLAVAPSGAVAWLAGLQLMTVDLDPASATFRQVLPGGIPLPTDEQYDSLVHDPATDRLYLVSWSYFTTDTTIRVFDVALPQTPTLLTTVTLPASDPGFAGYLAEARLVSFGGGSYLALARRGLQLVPLVGGVPDVPNRLEWLGDHPSGFRRRVSDLWAQDTVAGPRAFAVTNSITAVQAQAELLVFDLAQPLANGPLHVEPVTAADATWNFERIYLEPSLDGDHLYVLQEGGELSAFQFDQCRLLAYDLDTLASGLAGGLLDSIAIDTGLDACATNNWMVREEPPAPPSGPELTDATVVGAVAPDERRVVNDAARTLAITGTGLAGTTHAYLGQEVLALGTVTATSVEATVPPLTPSGNPRLLLVDASGAIASFDGLSVVNPPQFLPGTKVYAMSFARNQVIEMNASNANEVLSTFATGQGPTRPSVTPDGRFLLVPNFREASISVHSIVADPGLGWDWNEEVTELFGGFGAREIEVRADGKRAYLNNVVCKISVVNLETDPPTLVDTDADPSTTDYAFFDPYDPVQHALQAGITHIPTWDPNGNCNIVSNASVLSSGGEWLYLANYADPGIVVLRLGAHPDPDFVDPATDLSFVDVPGQPQFVRVDGLALSPDGGTLYWASSGETQVRRFAINPADGADLTEQAPIDLTGASPDVWTLATSPDGNTLYVAGRGSGSLRVVDVSVPFAREKAAVLLPWAPADGVVRPELEQAFAVDRERGRLRPLGVVPSEVARQLAASRDARLAPEGGDIVTVPVGGFAEAPAVSPDGNWLYVSAPGSGLVAIVDRRPGSPTLNQVLTTNGAAVFPGNAVPSPGLELACPGGGPPPCDPEPIAPSEGTTIDFSNVTGAGSTSVTSSNVSSVAVPADFEVSLPGGAPVFYDVTTDATFSGPVEVCFGYDDSGMTPAEEANVKLLHEEAGTFVDVTSSLDTLGNVVCGVVTGFSQFAQAIFTGAVVVDPPSPSRIAEPAGVATFTVRGSVEPTGSVTVPLAVSGECALSGGATEVVLTAANYLAGVAVGIEVVDDGDPEAQEICDVATGAAAADDGQAAYEGYDASDVQVLVVDDDSTDLAITKTDGVAAVAPGGQTTYTITLRNLGGAAVVGASFSDPIPAATSHASSGCSGGSNCSIAGGPVVTGSVDLAPGEVATFTVTVDVDPGASGALTNTATIDGFGGLADLFSGNDTASDTTRVQDGDPPGVAFVGSVADTGDGVLSEGEVTDVAITQLLLAFDEPVRSSDAGDPGRYSLYRSGPDQTFETSGCGPVAPEDEWVAVNAAAYAAQAAAVDVNDFAPLPDGLYQLRACAGIRDLEGNALDGDGDTVGGDDFLRTFRIDALPPTVESLGADFGPGYEPWDPNQPTHRELYRLFVTFSELVAPATAADAANFLLLAEGSDPGFQTVDCASGVAPEDDAIAFDNLWYEPWWRTTTIDLTGPENDYLPHGNYRLVVCGSTSIEDLAGRKLDGDYDQTGGDDFAVDFVVDRVAPEPPSTLFSTTHGPFTWSRLATIGMRFSGAYDNGPEPTTGVQGYDFVFTATGEDTDYAIDLVHGADPHDVLSPPLPDGLWTFRIRAFDNAWNVSWDRTAGPYFVDTTPPDPPGSVASPSHDGGPSQDPTIDVTWSPAADNLSGIDGYAWIFSASDAGTCDETLDGQEWVGSATSPALAEGSWYFHLCARDNAGNWGVAGVYGPWTVDTTGPSVASADSVPEAGVDGVAVPEVTVALTRLLIGFDEAMAESGAGSVTDAGNWQLVTAGPNGTLETGGCGPLGGDDVAGTVSSIGYDGGTYLAAVAVGDGTGLGSGRYRLLACATLTDLAGNALAGGISGPVPSSWSTDLVVVVDPRLGNPNFDTDTASWSLSGPQPADFSWQVEDSEGKPLSGSLRLETVSGVGDWYAEQCVELGDPGDHAVRALARVTGGTGGEPLVRGEVVFYDGPSCTGANVGSVVSPDLVEDTASAWLGIAALAAPAPLDALSARASLEVSSGNAASYTVEFDRAFFGRLPDLLSDGFETGDTCQWTQTSGGPVCP